MLELELNAFHTRRPLTVHLDGHCEQTLEVEQGPHTYRIGPLALTAGQHLAHLSLVRARHDGRRGARERRSQGLVVLDRRVEMVAAMTTAYRRFWAEVGERFPDLGDYYADNEQRLFMEHLPPLAGLRVLKTDPVGRGEEHKDSGVGRRPGRARLRHRHLGADGHAGEARVHARRAAAGVGRRRPGVALPRCQL
jgi:hypothetical protein